MQSSINELTTLAGQFRASDLRPPAEVVQALATLANSVQITHAIAATTQAKNVAAAPRVTWDCMALAGEALISVHGTRPAQEWYWASPGWKAGDELAAVFGTLDPLSEVVGCRLLSVECMETEYWFTRWQLQLRSGDSRPIPWSATNGDGHQEHETFALEVAKRLR
ncbi:hypothetical protein EV645_3986 [Kribbella rubisoli]|uniref:Uncharacterized protein n=1 Tax=Kribbella rubisoli TaxID=3075929 RepID=A0A4Q7X0U1_9ACTN|nr:hypothetical protein [Kribbella rubisoli]RZU16421.1 hypothetical protein EV645_3986 [Kribbella rubisoli]